MKFLPWKKSATLTTAIKTSSPNKTAYQKCHWCTCQYGYKMIQVPSSPDRLRIQLLNYLQILYAWPNQKED
jgi:hypothetical protein